ncbi:MAG TPA: hypothetical protein VGG30_13030 [Pirellulales bacterium]|jgi:hypothetical protein
MPVSSFRDPTAAENDLLGRLLAQDFPGRAEILQQLQKCQVQTVDENGSLEFKIDSSARTTSTKSRVPTEGEVDDTDGVTIHFLLHVVNDVVSYLEVFKEDNSQIVTMPAPECIRVFLPYSGPHG